MLWLRNVEFLLLCYLGFLQSEGSVSHQGSSRHPNPRPCQRGAQEEEERGGNHNTSFIINKHNCSHLFLFKLIDFLIAPSSQSVVWFGFSN